MNDSSRSPNERLTDAEIEDALKLCERVRSIPRITFADERLTPSITVDSRLAEVGAAAIDGWTRALHALKAERERAEQALDAEIARWQDAIYKVCEEAYPQVDGGGTESCDPLDFTLSEIQQTIMHVQNKLDDQRERAEQWKELARQLAECGWGQHNHTPKFPSFRCIVCEKLRAIDAALAAEQEEK